MQLLVLLLNDSWVECMKLRHQHLQRLRWRLEFSERHLQWWRQNLQNQNSTHLHVQGRRDVGDITDEHLDTLWYIMIHSGFRHMLYHVELILRSYVPDFSWVFKSSKSETWHRMFCRPVVASNSHLSDSRQPTCRSGLHHVLQVIKHARHLCHGLCPKDPEKDSEDIRGLPARMCPVYNLFKTNRTKKSPESLKKIVSS